MPISGKRLCCLARRQAVFVLMAYEEKLMKPSTILAASALGLAALYAPLAAAQSWGGTKRAPNVYQPDTDNFR
jgi:hypothetical protein